jgi:hypothetical protein
MCRQYFTVVCIESNKGRNNGLVRDVSIRVTSLRNVRFKVKNLYLFLLYVITKENVQQNV